MRVPTTTARELIEHLSEEFAAALPRAVVEAEVATAERELRGQVPDGAVAEMLHRLVDCRLRQRAQGAL
ncbi:hypothetical protein [Pseudonocardia humida]|uniref:Uncharacterized protein n=1 Tax=Pseudonocardia humida TaxID=2800819 RepID=A0ABT1ADQ8_9PSEU|nr:hypothetical protein [Pseudonocardia humida]MCO1661202.1 hypothetical protein [Pseudonocardia humida]